MLSEELPEVMSGSALLVQATETMLRGCLVHAQRGHLT